MSETTERLSEEFNEATALEVTEPVAPDCDVLLIDLSSLFYPAWHATADVEIGRAFEDTIFSVNKLRGAIPHKHLAVCCDAPPYWRKTVAPTYKAQRDTPSQVFVEQFRRTRERLVQDGLLLWRCDGFEADDVIATAASIAVAHSLTVTIATGDKDLMQLVNDATRVYSVNKRETFGPDEVFAKFGVAPSKVRDWLALCGDKSDNIPGVPGVGPKKAAQLLATFDNGHAVIESAKRDDERITPAVRKALAVHDGFDMAFRLVGLRFDAPIEFDALFAERSPQPLVETEEYDMPETDTQDAEFENMPQAEQAVPQSAQSATEREDKTPSATSTAIVAAPGSFELQLEPQNMTHALTMSKALHNSRLYSRFGTPEAIFAVIVRGREMGIGALTALDCFDMIEGRPAPKSHLIIARAKAHHDCEYFRFVDGDDTYAEYQTKNRNNPSPTTLKYTIEQARTAGIAPREPRSERPSQGKDDRSQWEKRPAEMLRKTAAVQLTRIEYPDASLGLYSALELKGEE